MDAVRTELARITATRPEDWFLAFKARYGMQQVFAALAATDRPRGVLTQALTCSTAVDPILVEGLTPVYGDISAASLALDPEGLQAADAVAALVIQHTFGVVDEARSRALAAAARGSGALVVEDAAHGLGRMARGEDGSPLADVSIHSFGVEKSLPTKFGGAVWVNPDMPDAELRPDIVARLASLDAPGRRLNFAARTYRTQLGVLRRLPSPLAGPARAALTAAGLFEPAVARSEQAGRLAHSDVGASAWVRSHMAQHLPELGTLERVRSAAVAAYAEVLGDLVPDGAKPHGASAAQPLIRMPVLVPHGVDADAVLATLRERGIYAGAWYRPALFPGATDPALYGYREDDPALGTTRDVIARIINLPTSVGADEARRIGEAARAAIG